MENHKNRFLKFVNKTESCWLWKGAKNKQGYGHFSIKHKFVSAHRFSYTIFIGEITGELHVLHKCDNPSCVNPNHLFLGTNHDNVLDSLNKGRRSSRKGEYNGRAKLNKNDVLDIRQLYKSGRHTQKSLSIKYGVTRSMIGYIVRNNSWN